jgi:hypothetical protein
MGDTKSIDQNTNGKKANKHGFENGKQMHKGHATNSLTSVNSDNFDIFKRKVSITCLEKYKNLGHLINDEKYYVLATIDMALYDLTNDPHEIKKVD